MKKTQRSFAVEYKSGRRQLEPKSNSIWGTLDLKSVARDVAEETMPFPSAGEQDVKLGGDEASLPGADRPRSLPKTALDMAKTIMADETDTMTIADAPDVVEAPVEKKQRNPRVKKATPETVPADVAAEAAVASDTTARKQKSARNPKVIEGAGSAKRTPMKRASTLQTTTAMPTAVIDEMTDLLRLEEENQRLRRLLAEKLRTENIDLRKRLKIDR